MKALRLSGSRGRGSHRLPRPNTPEMATMKRAFLFLLALSTLALPLRMAMAISVPPLVQPEWLDERLGAPGLSIIEMSNEPSFAFDGHIPRAAFTSKSSWREQNDQHTLIRLPARTLEKRFRELGVNDGDGVVIYYKGNDRDEVLGAYYRAHRS